MRQFALPLLQEQSYLVGFFFLKGCETELDHLFKGVLGYAMLVILGFAIVKVKFLYISEDFQCCTVIIVT